MNKGKGTHLEKYSIHLVSKKRKIQKFMKDMLGYVIYSWCS